MKEFEKLFKTKYKENVKIDNLIKETILSIDSVSEKYKHYVFETLSLSDYLLAVDDEISYSMAIEMEPYQLAILRLNLNIDNQTRLYAELNWE
jgi:hypothetical protein